MFYVIKDASLDPNYQINVQEDLLLLIMLKHEERNEKAVTMDYF